jgi:hypothetical protein
MKHTVIAIFTVLIIQINCFGQVNFTASPDVNSAGAKRLFLIEYASAGADTLPADSFKVITYSLLMKRNIAEEFVYYSKLSGSFQYYSSVSCDCYYTHGPLPKEDSLFFVLYTQKGTEFIELSKFSVAKKIPVKLNPVSKNALKIHGQLRSENYLSDGRFDYQQVPLNYSRNSLDMQLSVGDLPFRTGFLYTTESADINSFYFSFDYNTYKSNLGKALNDKRVRDAAANLNKDAQLQQQLIQINQDKFQIDNELKSPDYQKKLAGYKKEVAYGDADSVFKRTKRYRRAQLFVETDSLKRLQYMDLGRLEERINTESLKTNPRLYNKDVISDDRKLRSEFKESGIEQPAYGIFNSVRRFDIGTFTPRYNTLMLDGVQTFGVNLELSMRAAYLAVCGGELRSGLVNYGVYNRYRTSYTAMRAGVKQEKKYSFIFTGLRGNGVARNTLTEMPGSYLSTQVLGAEASYFITKNVQVRAEYARAVQDDDETNPYDLTLLRNQRREPFGFSDAWLFSAAYYAPNASTQLDLSYQQTGPGYFSVAAPYIRRDNRKIEARLNKKLYKNVWSMFTSIRADRDNLYKTKSGTTLTNWVTLGTKVSLPKLPFVIMSVSPLWQYTYISSLQTSVINKVNLYNVLVGYNYFTENVVNNTTFNYIKNSTYAMLNNEVNDRSFVMNTFIVNNSFYYKPYEVAVAVGIRSLRNVIDVNNSDSTATTSNGYDLLVTKKLPRLKTSVDAGYSYITGLGSMYRHIVRLGFNAVVINGLTINVRAEKHLIRQQFTSSAINLCRITLIQNF